MSWRRLRDLDEWRTRLALEGRVEVGPRRWLGVLLGAVCLPIALAMGLGAVLAHDTGVVALGIGTISLVLLASCVVQLVHALRPGPVLVVEPDGLHLPRKGLRVPWPALQGVDVRSSRYNTFVELRIDPRWRRRGRLRLPWPLDADPFTLASFLEQESRSR